MKNLVVLTGAGISAESGIATFRDSGGLWDKYPVEDVATPEGYNRDPELVLNFYNMRRRELLGTKPNRAHTLLAQLESDFHVQIVTQNIDNLHERAGSSSVVHLHGELMKGCSSKAPNNSDFIVDLDSANPDIKLGQLAKDGSQLRPFIVWFGEAVPEMDRAVRLVEKADVLLVIGTSLNVYPAAGLLHYAKSGIPIYLIDPAEMKVKGGLSIYQINMVATKGMEEFIRLMNSSLMFQ